jgi:hypothetical protein
MKRNCAGNCEDDGTVTRPTFLLLREIAVQLATGAPAGAGREESK